MKHLLIKSAIVFAPMIANAQNYTPTTGYHPFIYLIPLAAPPAYLEPVKTPKIGEVMSEFDKYESKTNSDRFTNDILYWTQNQNTSRGVFDDGKIV